MDELIYYVDPGAFLNVIQRILVLKTRVILHLNRSIQNTRH